MRLSFETVLIPTRAGGTMKRFRLAKGRFRLGQRQGNVPQYVLKRSAGRTLRNLLGLVARVDRVFDGEVKA